jgi:hypothetical protein
MVTSQGSFLILVSFCSEKIGDHDEQDFAHLRIGARVVSWAMRLHDFSDVKPHRKGDAPISRRGNQDVE